MKWLPHTGNICLNAYSGKAEFKNSAQNERYLSAI